MNPFLCAVYLFVNLKDENKLKHKKIRLNNLTARHKKIEDRGTKDVNKHRNLKIFVSRSQGGRNHA